MINNCGCCKGLEKLTPATLNNRPGLSALSYRIGTHSTFLATMLSRLSSEEYPELRSLSTRQSYDPGIALMDAWATVADVLTFYQERIANEGYLRTAVERFSLVELASLVGYKPKPGLSASTYLAFMLEDGYKLEIPAKTKVQTLPAPGELPQFFETSERLEARSEWNILKPRMNEPQDITIDNVKAEIHEINVEGRADLKENFPLVFDFGLDDFNNSIDGVVIRRITNVEYDPLEDRTIITLNPSFLRGINRRATKGGLPVKDPGIPKGSDVLGRIEGITHPPLMEAPKPGSYRRASGGMPSKTESLSVLNEIPKLKRIIGFKEVVAHYGQNAPLIISDGKPPSEWELNFGNRYKAKITLDGWDLDTNSVQEHFKITIDLFDDSGKSKGNYAFDIKLSEGQKISYLNELTPPSSIFAYCCTLMKRKLENLKDLKIFIKLFFKESDFNLTFILNYQENIKTEFIIKDNNNITYLYTIPPGIKFQSQTSEVKIDDNRSERISIENKNIVILYTTYIPYPIEQAKPVPAPRNNLTLDTSRNEIQKNDLIVIYRPNDNPSNPLSNPQSTVKVIAQIEETSEVSSTDYNIAHRSTKLNLKNIWRWNEDLDPNKSQSKRVYQWVSEKDTSLAVLRNTSIYIDSFELKLAKKPIERKVEAANIDLEAEVHNLKSGRLMAISGTELSGDEQGELFTLKDSIHDVPRSKPISQEKTFMCGLWGSYKTIYSESYFAGYIKDSDPEKNLFYSKSKDSDSLSHRQLEKILIDNKPKLDDVIEINGTNGLDLEEGYKLIFSEIDNTTGTFKLSLSRAGKPSDSTYDIIDQGIIINPKSPSTVDHTYYFKKQVGDQTDLVIIGIHFIAINKSAGIFIPAIDGIWQISETPIIIDDIIPGGIPYTTLLPAQPNSYEYQRQDLKIYGNVVKATQGETHQEILGSGDSSKAFQEIALRQQPLTYLPVPTPSGSEAALTTRINGVRWHETEFLAEQGPTDRSYIIRTDNEDKSSVLFGDGKTGARTPTGIENIAAEYRTGIGRSGNAKQGQISILASKPLGLKDVTNPLAATGGADRDSPEAIRYNTPLVATSLDHLVSVQDYEDFARTFAGIGKASACLLSDGKRQFVHITIAGADDIPISKDSDLYQSLLEAMHRYGDQDQAIKIDIFEKLLIVIAANVKIQADYKWELVEPKIRSRLLDAFSFQRRELGQDVLLSEVISIIQNVQGVEYVDVDALDSIGGSSLSDQALDDLNKRLASPSAPNPRIPVAMAGPDTEYKIEDDIDPSIFSLDDYLNLICENFNVSIYSLKRRNPDLEKSWPFAKDTILKIPKISPAQLAILSPEVPEILILNLRSDAND